MNIMTPAGWHTDPHRRHALRYWDGTRWTDHVQTAAGEVVVEPAEPRRATVRVSGLVALAAGVAALVSVTASTWVKTTPLPDSFGSPQTYSRSDISTLLSFTGRSNSGLAEMFLSVGWVMLLLAIAWCTTVAFGGIAKSRVAAVITGGLATIWALVGVLALDDKSETVVVHVQLGAYLAVVAGAVAAIAALGTGMTLGFPTATSEPG